MQRHGGGEENILYLGAEEESGILAGFKPDHAPNEHDIDFTMCQW